MVLEIHVKLCVTEPDFPKIIFCPQNWENRPKMGQKQVFLNLLQNLFVIKKKKLKIYIIYLSLIFTEFVL